MLVHIQWSRANTPQDWQAYEIASLTDWRKLPQKDEPEAGGTGLVLHNDPEFGDIWVPDPSHPTADDEGWINELCIAGIHMSGADHHYAGRDGPRLRYVRWNDDIEWEQASDRYAQEFSFAMPVEDPEIQQRAVDAGLFTQAQIDAMSLADKARFGFVAVDVVLSVWAEDPARQARYQNQMTGPRTAPVPLVVSDWASFSPPGPANMVRHGVFMTAAQVAAHEAALTFDPDLPWWAGLTGA